MLSRPWKTAFLSAQLLHTAAQTEVAVAGGGQRGWWTLQYALLQATYKPPSSGGGNPPPPKRLHGRQLRELGGCASMQNRKDRAGIMGHYPHSCMALMKRGETKIFPSVVLCAHFVLTDSRMLRRYWRTAGLHQLGVATWAESSDCCRGVCLTDIALWHEQTSLARPDA